MTSHAALSPAPVISQATRTDFPGWLPAMLVKELRQALRTKGFVATFVGFHVIAVIAFWWSIELNAASGQRGMLESLNAIFWGLLNVVLLLVMPWRGLGALRMEMDSRTLDLLVLTRLTGWRIVLGKWSSLVAQALLFLIAIMPYGVARYFFGSVDLTTDLVLIGYFCLVSATLVAMALWISTLPKLLRVLLPMVALIAGQSLGLSSMLGLTTGRAYGLRALTGSSTLMAGAGVMVLLVCVLLVLIFLGLAVRRLAPRAENHAQIARSFALVLVCGLMLAMATWLLDGQVGMVTGLVVILIVGGLEMAHDRLPMNAHWRPWARRGALGAWTGRLFLPGWPSAALYAVMILFLYAFPSYFLPDWRPANMSAPIWLWFMVQAWVALVFPALLLSFLPATSGLRIGGSGYFVVQGLFGIVSLLSASHSTAYLVDHDFARALDVVCHVIPVSSFWLGKDSFTNDSVLGIFFGQIVVLLVVIGFVYRQSRAYWAQVKSFDAAPVEKPVTPAIS